MFMCVEMKILECYTFVFINCEFMLVMKIFIATQLHVRHYQIFSRNLHHLCNLDILRIS